MPNVKICKMMMCTAIGWLLLKHISLAVFLGGIEEKEIAAEFLTSLEKKAEHCQAHATTS